MRITRFVLHLLIIFSLVVPCMAQDVVVGDDTRSLGDVARETRARVARDRAAHIKTRSMVAEAVEEISLNNEDDYEGHVRDLLQKQDFDGLERTAELARSRQSRFPGGTWKLFDFYDSVSSPVGGASPSEEDWRSLIAELQHWVALHPRSVTARIALGQAYLNYGIKARGGGYSNSVTEEGWQRLGAGSLLAEATLREADELPDQDPYLYSAMLEVATYGGWSKQRTREAMEKGSQFAPDFCHSYRIYANYLLPKWYGQPGEMEAFATKIADRLGGDDGNFVYFELGSLVGCGCSSTRAAFSAMSWPRMKKGYAALESLYGTSNLKMNRFAMMATEAHDEAAAKPVFESIGERWDPRVWKSQQAFETARGWAMAASN